MEKYKTLAEAAAVWLKAAVGGVEDAASEKGLPVGDVTIKFTWKGQDYEASVKKL